MDIFILIHTSVQSLHRRAYLPRATLTRLLLEPLYSVKAGLMEICTWEPGAGPDLCKALKRKNSGTRIEISDRQVITEFSSG